MDIQDLSLHLGRISCTDKALHLISIRIFTESFLLNYLVYILSLRSN